jgi:tetratricopeptide (TPR) repeat protein
MTFLRPASAFLIVLAFLAPLRADESGESMADHEFHQIYESQATLLADAAKEGDKLDEESLRLQAQAIVHQWERFITDNPKYADAYAAYGDLLRKMDMRKRSLTLFLKANQLDPDNAFVKNEIGDFVAEEGKPLEAVNYFMAAIKLAPNEPLYHYQLGTLLHEARDDFLKSGEWTREDLDNAMQEAFRRAAELAPDRIEFTHRYAESFADMPNPDWDAALKVWAQVEGQARTPAEVQEVRLQTANILIKQGRFEAARILLSTVTEPVLQGEKQKLAALMPENQKK